MYVYKYSVDMYLLCMIKARVIGGVLVVCGESYNLGLSLWFCFLLHSILFLKLKPHSIHTK